MKQILIFCAVLVSFASAQAALLPLPLKLQLRPGNFFATESFGIELGAHPSTRLILAKKRALAALSQATGLSLLETRSKHPALWVRVQEASPPYPKLGDDESYSLLVSQNEIVLSAKSEWGALHGLQTFLQLVEPTQNGFTVQAQSIEDHPRFSWRGLLIDSARHFLPLDAIKRNLDGMEVAKLNVLHWHLSDDQGFRVESKRFPNLIKKNLDQRSYTQAQILDLVHYASLRGIRVVPEFDMPGHTSSWVSAYPELASSGGAHQTERLWTTLDSALDPTRDQTYEFIDQLIGEMSSLFADAYFHTGGDECNGKAWDANPQIQAFMKAHGFKTNEALQAYFTNRVQKLVVKHRKIPEGWDEILQVNTPKNVVIQAWNDTKPLAVAAGRGYPSILSRGYYLDLNQSAAEHYAIDPDAAESAELSESERKNILGGEAALWAEFVSAENIDGKIWPRAAAVAERLWSAKTVTDVNEFYSRLLGFSQQLENHGLKHLSYYEPMLRRILGSADINRLKVLADVMQPLRKYERHDLQTADQFTPLTRLVDAIHSESDQAREFNELAKRYAAGKATDSQKNALRLMLLSWRDNDQFLQCQLTLTELAQELIPVSAQLTRVAALGLNAMDEPHKRSPWWLQTKDLELAKAYEPRAAMVIAVIPGVRALVQASAH